MVYTLKIIAPSPNLSPVRYLAKLAPSWARRQHHELIMCVSVSKVFPDIQNLREVSIKLEMWRQTRDNYAESLEKNI